MENPWSVAGVRFGSLAVVHYPIRPMAASGWKAAIRQADF
jgi:hypothetical protein